MAFSDPSWALHLRTAADGRPRLTAELQLRGTSRLTLHVSGVEVLGDGRDRVIRLSPLAAGLDLEVDAHRLRDPDRIGHALAVLRTRLAVGIVAPVDLEVGDGAIVEHRRRRAP